MKLVLVALVIALSPFIASANLSEPVIPPDLSTALGKGDVSTISSYFAEKVEVKISGESETLMKTEATTRVREFFAGNPAQSFKPIAMDSKTEKPAVEVGELTTAKGKYRVYVEFTEQAQKPKITSLRFEQ